MFKNDLIRQKLEQDPALAAEVARIQAERAEAERYTPLTAIRQAAGLTRADLAERLGMTDRELAELEAVGEDWTLSTLARYADAAGARLTLTAKVGDEELDFAASRSAGGFLML
ncbi:helix-turn-helix domain-containing protein [Mycobacterium sp. PDNC021]|uniref:helix-turn-helix domain-containing protein n=1 Tax=Mycobacterium sp. PDNC021 TaxID=3391399 RepID=UPI003AAB2C26